MSEEEIQEELEKIYNLEIDVKWKDFRLYEIYIKIRYKETLQMRSVTILYDVLSTKEANIHNIVNKIDNEIVKMFKEKE